MKKRINQQAGALAILLACAPIADAASWTKTAGGTYVWNTGSNWDSAFPNGAGAIANLNVGLIGDQTLNMNQAITIGTLNAGDTGGTPAVKTIIASGSGGNPLTFQGASSGSPTAINVFLGTAPASGDFLSLPNINLAANSPLTITVNSTAYAGSKMGAVNLNGNTVTLVGAPRTNSELSVFEGVAWQVSSLTGSGHLIMNGTGARIVNPSPGFTGKITVNNGTLWFETGNLKSASEYILGGAWNNFSKYPKGGRMLVGAGSPAFTTIQDRLNPNATMTLKSGFFQYSGQSLAASLAGSNVVEQIRQMRFENGMSQIRMQNGNWVAASATLLVNDPVNACVRLPGATAMIGGDDELSRNGDWIAAMGAGEKLIFASGMSQYLKGSGGADGSMSKSIIPWVTIGTLYHPGQGRFATYDNVNGVRPLDYDEYYYVPNAGTVYGIDPSYNVCTTSREASSSILNLGTNDTQTINSISDDSRGNSDIGAGSVLTVTSGAIHFGGPAKIGANRATAGTLNFGSAEGVIWTDFESLYGDNQIGSTITGSGGLTMAGNNRLIITGVNTYTGKTSIGSGIMRIGNGTLTDCKLGNGDVEVAAGGTLSIAPNVANAIGNTANIFLDNNGDLFFGMFDLSAGINETVGRLYLDGLLQPVGTYGSSTSAATFKLDHYFSGNGILTSVPEPGAPSGCILAAIGLIVARSRKRKALE